MLPGSFTFIFYSSHWDDSSQFGLFTSWVAVLNLKLDLEFCILDQKLQPFPSNVCWRETFINRLQLTEPRPEFRHRQQNDFYFILRTVLFNLATEAKLLSVFNARNARNLNCFDVAASSFSDLSNQKQDPTRCLALKLTSADGFICLKRPQN